MRTLFVVGIFINSCLIVYALADILRALNVLAGIP